MVPRDSGAIWGFRGSRVYDRHSYDREKREALEAWSKRLMMLVSDLQAVSSEA